MWESWWPFAGVELNAPGASKPMIVIEEDTLAVFVGILRLVLPCLLLIFTFGHRFRIPWLTDRRKYARDLMLQHHRQVAAGGGPAPEEMANIVLVTEDIAPALFQKPPPPKPRGDRERRDERGDRRDERGDRERRDGERRSGTRDKPKGETEQAAHAIEEAVHAQAAAMAAEKAAAAQASAEENMHLESLVNFVAFNKREQIRVFLPDDDFVPRPPPKLAKAPITWAPKEASRGKEDDSSNRANKEAQMVLRGALLSPKSGAMVAIGLHSQLMDLEIAVNRATFELMVNACVQAKTLQAASDLLMSMEAAGHSPSNELLDQVMELYLVHKSDEPAKKKAEAEAAKAEAEATAAQVALAPAAAASSPTLASTLPSALAAHHSGFPAAAPVASQQVATSFEFAGITPIANANPPPPPPGPPPLDMLASGPGAVMSQALPAMQHHQPLALSGGPPGPSGFVPNPVAGPWNPGYTVPPMDGMGQSAGWPQHAAPPREPEPRDDLPVFSIPEEFSTIEIEEKPTASKEAAADGEAGEARNPTGALSGTFNPDAAEFVPGGVGQASGGPAPEKAVPPPGATRRDGFASEGNGYGGISASANLAMAMGRGAETAAYGFGGQGYDYGHEAAGYGNAGSQMDMPMSSAEIGHNVWGPGGSFEASSEYSYAPTNRGVDGYGNYYDQSGIQDDYSGSGQWDMLGQVPNVGGQPSNHSRQTSMRSKASMPLPRRGPQEELGDLRSQVRILTEQLQQVQVVGGKGKAPPRPPLGKGAWQHDEANGKGKAKGAGKAGGPCVVVQERSPEDEAEFRRLEDQRHRYGEQLFGMVQAIEPRMELTQRITGMLLELPQNELLLNLGSHEELSKRIDEAIKVLRLDGIIND